MNENHIGKKPKSSTFIFDIYGETEGRSFIKILEIRNSEQSGIEKQEFIVFEEDLDNFTKMFHEAISDFRKLRQPDSDVKTYSVEKIREEHAKAYTPWTAEDDSKLERLFCEGKKLKQLAETFRRNEGAITSRIKKLELYEKYGRR